MDSSPAKDIICINEEETELRIDQTLAKRYCDFSRSYFQGLIEKGHVLINGKTIKKRIKPLLNDQIEVSFRPKELNHALLSQNIPLDIIYEDEHLIVVNKPAGMVVHPAPGNWSDTFVNALLFHCSNLAKTDDILRPGIIHRLDKETSGVIIAAKNSLTHTKMVEQFSNRSIHKEYLAICIGPVKTATIDLPIGRHPIHRKKMAIVETKGKHAVTLIQPIAFNGTLSQVRLIPKTGRTHQLRVHMQQQNRPILGDSLYGNPSINKHFSAHRHYLHAEKIRFHHPRTQELLEFQAPIPQDMEALLCAF